MKTLLGWSIAIFSWWFISFFEIINPYILPSPMKVLITFITLIQGGDFFSNVWFSVKINFMGYIIAILVAVPIGFAIGLFKTLREMFSPIIDASRFVPLTATSGIFLVMFGLTIWTKTNFLAFGIILFLIPATIQRLDEISQISIQMMRTLGATRWQTFIYLQFPSVMSRLTDDVRLLVGLSWTYLIVAETKPMTQGLGTQIFLGERQSNPGIVYACLITIIIIGILQDQLFKYIDKLLFKYKYL